MSPYPPERAAENVRARAERAVSAAALAAAVATLRPEPHSRQ